MNRYELLHNKRLWRLTKICPHCRGYNVGLLNVKDDKDIFTEKPVALGCEDCNSFIKWIAKKDRKYYGIANKCTWKPKKKK